MGERMVDSRNVDFVAWDNSDPPQLWAWSGIYGDESAEPLFRLPADDLRIEFDNMSADLANAKALWNAAVECEGSKWASEIVALVEQELEDEAAAGSR